MKQTYTDTQKKILERQRELLSKINKTDSYISDLINVSPSAVNRFKNGRNLMSVDKLVELDSAFGLDLNYFFGRKPIYDDSSQSKLNQLNSKLSTLNQEDKDLLLEQFISHYDIFVKYKKILIIIPNRKKIHSCHEKMIVYIRLY